MNPESHERDVSAVREALRPSALHQLGCHLDPKTAQEALAAFERFYRALREAERERDESQANADGMARAPYGEFQNMRRERDKARWEKAALREALEQIAQIGSKLSPREQSAESDIARVALAIDATGEGA